MNRKISWKSYVLDEIELVYDKAEENETIGQLLEKLEEQALSEARENCILLKTSNGEHITPEQFDGLSERDKETIIRTLASVGLASFSQNMPEATLIIRLSAGIQRVMACTFFDILNRLEKLDGALNVFIPEWTLELQAPLGGKKGLMQWEMLITLLYPWISVREISTNELAEEVSKQQPEAPEKPEQPGKKSFWQKLFNR